MTAIDPSTAPEVMKWSDWITLLLGVAAFGGAIWSNFTASRALRATGRQRSAEFRKEWIEELRRNLAEFENLTSRRSVLFTTNIDISGLPEHLIRQQAIFENTKEINAAFDRCRHIQSFALLMLDPTNPAQQQLGSSMSELLAKENPDAAKIFDFRKNAQAVLKMEWDLLKAEIY